MNIVRRFQFASDRRVTVANLVDELLLRKGDCIVSVDEGGPYRLSELHEDICSLDAFLRQTIGLHPGQLVAIYRTNDRRCFHWFLAIIRAGGVAVPLNPQLSLNEVQRILSESGTEVLVTDRSVFEQKIETRDSLAVRTWIQDDQTATMDGFIHEVITGGASAPTEIDPRATIAVFHTSGTSGFPKGAALSSSALLGARASTVFAGLILGSKDLALVSLPWSHIMSVSIALYGLMAGIPGCFLEHFNIDRALELIERLHVTTVVGVPAIFARLVNTGPDPERLASVRVWLSASDHLPSDVRERLRKLGALLRLPGGKRLPPVLLNGYGMVELGGLAMMGIDLSFAPGSGDLCFPVPPFRIRVTDENGHKVKAGATGECQIQRRGLNPHYWRDKQGSDSLVTEDGWLRTGDLAKRNWLGLVRIVGRAKDVIKSGGYSVYVRELEEAISEHPDVIRAIAFGLPHEEKGEIPVAVVELEMGALTGEDDLLEWCKKRLAGYKAPRRIWILAHDDMPRTVNGKVQRHLLRERFANEVKA